MKFSDIPLRINGEKIIYAWFDALRAAGLRLEQVFGSGLTIETQFAVDDNQSSYADITGMTVDGALYVYAEIRYSIYRTDGALERRETGSLMLEYIPISAAWRIADHQSSSDALGLPDALTVVTTAGVGQVKYKSDLMGTTIGKMRWKTVNTIGVET